MARKSNKQQQARKQHKQQRRKARTSRRDTGRSRLRLTSPSIDNDLIADMQPLLHGQGNMAFPGAGMEGLMLSILASEDMADEPELKNIVFDPIRCVNTFAEVGEEMGYTPETLADLSEDKHEEVQLQILETSIQRVLNKTLQQDILAGLKALRARWNKEGKPDVARVSTLQSFLVHEGSLSTWAMTGLVQALFHRSMMIGFELFEATADVLDSSEAGADDAVLLEHLNQSTAAQKIGALLQEHPEIRDYMEDEADKVWEEGQEAVYAGLLHLGLFTEDELQNGLKIFAEMMGYDETTGEHKEISPGAEEIRSLISRIHDYVTGLLTSQRFAEMRDRLALVLKEKPFEQKWFSFVYLFAEDMKAEDAIETQTELLVRIFFGEMRTLNQTQNDENDAPSEDADL
jgi:hypothetical protein